jgi:hypothetical protein
MQEEVWEKSAIFSDADEARDIVFALVTLYRQIANLDEIDGFPGT